MPKNKYDFQVGDIIIEEDKSWDIPSSCFMYHILEVSVQPPNVFNNDTKHYGSGTVGTGSAWMKDQYIPDDCTITVMYTNVSGSGMLDKQYENQGEGQLHTQFLFSKNVWDKSQHIRKIRGNVEYRLSKGKWVKR